MKYDVCDLFEDLEEVVHSDLPDAYLEYVEKTEGVDNSQLYWSKDTPKSLEELVIKMANRAGFNISLEDYQHLLQRGMKPTKALYRLGIDQQLAGILGSLKIAVTAEEIQEIYNNPNIKSCMSARGELYKTSTGEFYHNLGISLLYNDRYRILIDLQRNWRSERGYGVLCNTLDKLLNGVLSRYVLEIEVYPESKFKIVEDEYALGWKFIDSDLKLWGIDCLDFPYLDTIDLNMNYRENTDFHNRVISRVTESDCTLNTYLDLYEIISSQMAWEDYQDCCNLCYDGDNFLPF